MTLMTNGRAFGLSVGSSLYLPDGRMVRLADTFGWEESDGDVDEASPSCRMAAGLAQAVLSAREEVAARRAAEEARNAAGRATGGDVPAEQALRPPGKEDRGTRRGGLRPLRCEALVERAEALPEEAEEFASGVTETLAGMAATARRIGKATPRMESALDGIDGGVSGWER